MMMKKVGLISFALLLGGSVSVFSQEYDGAGDRVFLSRSPVATQQSLDSDIRLRGMGGLNLAVKDESNELGVFKYGGSPAGLPADYTRGKAELGFYLEQGTVEDESAIANPLKGDVYDSDVTAFQGMVAYPFETGDWGRGAGVVSFVTDDGEADYTSGGALNYFGATTAKNKPGLNTFDIGYGHSFNNFIAGISINVLGLDPLKLETSAGNVTFEQDSSDVTLSFGYVFDIADEQQLTIVAGPNIRNVELMIEETAAGEKSDHDLDGVKIDAGVHYQRGEEIKAGLFLRTGEVSGDIIFTEPGKVTTFNADADEFSLNARVYYNPMAIPLSFGAEYAIETDSSKIDIAGTSISDTDESTTEFGIGAAWHIGEDKGLVGLEVKVFTDEDEDNIDTTDPDENETRDGTEIILGGEWNVMDPLSVRLGLRLRAYEEEPKGAKASDVSETEISLGGEYRFEDRASVSAVIANTTIDSDSVNNAVLGDADDLSFSGISFQLLGKIYF